MVFFIFSVGLMMMEVVDRVRRISLEKINSEKGRMGLGKRQMVANILTATIAMLNVIN